MKKNLTYILIIITLVGFFSPIFIVHGETNLQHCIANAVATGTTSTQASVDCANIANPGEEYGSSTIGTCTIGTSYTEQTTAADCTANGGTWATPYVFLAPLPCDPATAGPGCVNGKLTTFDPTSQSGQSNNKIGDYLNVMIRIFIGLCAVLAVVMIVIGGIQYMTSELISSKGEGKERILHAIFGLLLALGAWTLLNQINPDILRTDLNSLQSVTVDVALGGESSAPFVDIKSTLVKSTKVNCSSNLVTTATSFIGNATYSQTARNTVNPDGTVNVDCSSYVDQVYACAGLPNPGNNTTAIFSSGATKITPADLSSLKPGDLLGWTAGQSGQKDGHVLMYIGNGQIIDAQGSGVGVTARPLSPAMQSMITYIKRAP